MSSSSTPRRAGWSYRISREADEQSATPVLAHTLRALAAAIEEDASVRGRIDTASFRIAVEDDVELEALAIRAEWHGIDS